MSNDIDQRVIAEFRAHHGKVGGAFAQRRLLLLTTTGAKSGLRRTTPVGYVPDGVRMLIFAANSGAPRHPGWYHNLRANPHVTVEAGAWACDAEAVILEAEERDRLFARAAEADPVLTDHQAKTERVIPVVALHPVFAGPPSGRWGDHLVTVHDGFRRELALIRKEIADSAGSGQGRGPGLILQLRVNCLAFCHGLHQHHGGEDGRIFPTLEAHHPELAPALRRLRREHGVVKDLVDDIQALVSADAADPAAVLAELDRLAAELEAHLDYEEEQLVPLLNAASG